MSVLVLSWNSREDLEGVFCSLGRQTYPALELILVDNGSADGGPDLVADRFPHVRILRAGSNLGYAGGNNLGFHQSRGELVCVLNADTEVDPDFIATLAAAFSDPRVGLAAPRVCHFADRARINACGNEIHVSGLGYCRGVDEPASRFDGAARVAAVSGCAFMARRELLGRLGGFDDDFFMYVEDTDLSVRASLAGYRIVYVPESLVYHRYSLRLSPAKFFLLERNRRLMLLKCLRGATLIALAPSALLTGALMWLYALSRGPRYVAAKLRAQAWTYRNWGLIMAKRRRVQALRTAGDAELVGLLSTQLPFREVVGDGPVVRLAAPLVNLLYAGLSWPVRALAR